MARLEALEMMKMQKIGHMVLEEPVPSVISPLPKDSFALEQSALQRSLIGPHLHICTGIYYREDEEHSVRRYPVKGDYGLVYLHPATKEILARAGFEVCENVMQIDQTPTGSTDSIVSKKAHRYFSTNAGRRIKDEMMEELIAMAREMGLEQILGASASRHIEVRSGFITLEKGKHLIDDLFERFGFQRIAAEGGDLYQLILDRMAYEVQPDA